MAAPHEVQLHLASPLWNRHRVAVGDGRRRHHGLPQRGLVGPGNAEVGLEVGSLRPVGGGNLLFEPLDLRWNGRAERAVGALLQDVAQMHLPDVVVADDLHVAAEYLIAVRRGRSGSAS